MKAPAGIGKLERKRITTILRNTKHTISTAEAAKILDMTNQEVAKLLSRWTTKGWLSRVKRGLYVLVPLESTSTDVALDDPWIIAENIYRPCYIGGWSAAEYWGLTEQVFRTIMVLTIRKPRKRNINIKGINFLLRTVSDQAMFGLQELWRGQIKVSISDPTRTVVDLLIDPRLGGGIRSVMDMFTSYINSEHKNLELLINYAQRLNNRAVFKRLGFLLEQLASTELAAIEACKKQINKGNIKLDPQLEANKLITRWRLWIPKAWEK